MNRLPLIVAMGFAVLPACKGNVMGPGESDAVADRTAPLLSVTTPVRGTLSQGAGLGVTGRAEDAGSGVASVTVNGAVAQLAADGAFSVTLDVAPGITVLETIVLDRAGNQARDVRAVLTGTLAPVGQPLTDALAAKLGPEALATVGQVLGGLVGGMDLTAPAVALNPVVDMGGSCLGAKVNVESIDKGAVQVALLPESGAIGADVQILALDVRLRANYKVACIGGSSSIRIRATRTRLTGQLALGTDAGRLTSAVNQLELGFEGFDVDVSGLPGVIVDLLQRQVNDAVASAVRDAVADAVPGMAAGLLGELDGGEWSIGALGQTITVAITPSALQIDSSGVFAALGGKISVAGGDGAEYLSTPSPAAPALMGTTSGLGIGIADDLVNQLLAGLWASRALEQSLPLGPDHPASIFFGPDADRIELSLSLPPTLSVDAAGELRLVVGDLMVQVIDDGGAGVLAEFAVSLAVGFSAQVSTDGRLLLALGTPQVWAQVLAQQSDLLPRELDANALAAMVGLLSGQLAERANEALSSLPIPAIGDARVENATVGSGAGFVLLAADLVAAP